MGVETMMRFLLVAIVLSTFCISTAHASCAALIKGKTCSRSADQPEGAHKFLGWMNGSPPEDCRKLCELERAKGCCLYQKQADGTACFFDTGLLNTNDQCADSIETSHKAAVVCDDTVVKVIGTDSNSTGNETETT